MKVLFALFRTGIACLSIYLFLSLPLTDSVYIPHIFFLLLAVLTFHRMRRWRLILFLEAAAIAFALFNLLTTADDTRMFLEQGKSVVYFLYLFGLSLAIGGIPFFETRTRPWAAGCFLAAGWFLLIYAGLEQRSVGRFQVGAFSEKFRQVVYNNAKYENDARDIELTGSVRPKAFTREPSHAARGVAVLFLIGALASQGVFPRVMALLGIAAAVAIFGSPVPAAFFFCLIVGGFVPRRVQQKGLVLPYLGLLSFVGAVALAGLVYVIPPLHQRAEMIMDSSDASAQWRTTYVLDLAQRGLKINWLSGVGFGGEDKLGSYASSPGRETVSINTMINNTLFSIPLFCGFSGVIVFTVFMVFVIRSVPPRFRLCFFFFVLAIMNCTGAINSTEGWVAGAILYSVLQTIHTLDTTPARTPPARAASP